jgi:DNA-binding transcriptional LysR family regulator
MLPSLDLNLIAVLYALLEERNVTRAGERIGLSQPATSTALGRLRRHFDDPLLERVSGGYVLTPMAQGLLHQTRETIKQMERLLTVQPHFEPERAERRFTVQCSDSVLAVLGPPLLAEVSRTAPNVELDILAIDGTAVQDPVSCLQRVDVLVAPRGVLADQPHMDLYRDRWVCLAWTGNRTVGDALDRAAASSARWIMPFRQIPSVSPADAALASLGIDRHSVVNVQSFAVLDRLVVGTDLLALAHERLLVDRAIPGLRTVRLPVELPEVIEAAWWHPSRRLDPGHRWLLERLRSAAARLDGGTALAGS